MNLAFHKLTAPVFDWIPDISAVPPRRRAAIGVVASLVFHLLVVLLIILLGAIAPQRIDFAKSRPKPREIELTIVPPPEETIMPFTLAPPKVEQPFLDSRGLQISKEAALNSIFQSDENMQAASESPATGDIPLPSQQGRDRPFNAFTTQKSLLGSAVEPFAPAPEPAPSEPPVTSPKVAQQQAPAATPPPKALEKVEAVPATPSPLKAVNKPREDEIALASRAVAPPPTAISKMIPAATPRPVEQQAMLTTPAPRPQTPKKTGFQPEQEQNRIEGNISNRGKKAVDAVATPLAKYRKQVNDAIGSRWYHYIKPKMDLIAAGSVRISFAIDEQGHITGIKIDSNTSNTSFAEVCERAVRDAEAEIKEIKPPPADATALLKDGRMECSLTFTFYNL